MFLSPTAAPFHPTYEPVNLAIYNDGVPSMTLVSEEEISQVLHGITDEALDEGFPPTAADAAEMEAVQAFVEFMAYLAQMEELEESARSSFTHVQKRWEVRRAQGLKGRPKPAKKHAVAPNNHLPKATTNCQAIVPHTHRHMEVKLRHQELARHRVREHPRIRKMQHVKNRDVPIIQPRKFS